MKKITLFLFITGVLLSFSEKAKTAPTVDVLNWKDSSTPVYCNNSSSDRVVMYADAGGDHYREGWDDWKCEIKCGSHENYLYSDNDNYVELHYVNDAMFTVEFFLKKYLSDQGLSSYSGTVQIRIHGRKWYQPLFDNPYWYSGKWSTWKSIDYINGPYGTIDNDLTGVTSTFVGCRETFSTIGNSNDNYFVHVYRNGSWNDLFYLTTTNGSKRSGDYLFNSTGNYTLRAYKQNNCGSGSTNYEELDVRISSMPGRPTSSSTRINYGETITLSFPDRDEQSSYQWDIQPISAVIKNELSDGRCEITMTSTADVTISAKVRGVKSNGEYTSFSDSYNIQGIGIPETPTIKGDNSFCYSNGISLTYSAGYSGYGSNFEWKLANGNNGSITSINDRAIVRPNSNTDQFTVMVRRSNGINNSEWADIEVNKIESNNIDFSNVIVCSKNGNVELEGFSPSGGEYWIEDNIISRTYYPTNTFKVTQGSSGTVEFSTKAQETIGDFSIINSPNVELLLSFNTSIPSTAVIKEATMTIYHESMLNQDPELDGIIGILNGYYGPGMSYNLYASGKLNGIDIMSNLVSQNGNQTVIDIKDIIKMSSVFYLEQTSKIEKVSTHLDILTKRPRINIKYATDHTINTDIVGNSKEVTYRLNVGGCNAIKTERVTVLPTPEVSFTAQEICTNEVPVRISGGYSNDNNATNKYFGEGVNEGYFENGNPGSYEVIFRSESVNGCIAQVNDYLTVKSLPNPTINADDDICAGNNLNVSIPSGYTNIEWEFNNLSRSGNNVSFPIETTSNRKIETLSVEITQNGCNNIIEKDILINKKPLIELGDKNECQNTDITINPENEADVIGYQWSDGTTGNSISLHLTKATPYSVTVTSPDGCVSSDNAMIFMKTPPSVRISGVTNSCKGEEVRLEALEYDPRWQYEWSVGYGQANYIDFVPSNDGINNVSVYVKGVNGCWGNATTQVYVNQNPEISLQDQDGCIGVPNMISAQHGFRNYYWSTGVTGTPSLSYTPLTSGLERISCEVEDYNGCRGSDEMELYVHNPTPFNLETLNENEFCINSAATLRGPEGNYEYRWSNGSNDQTSQFNLYSSGNYTLTVTDIYGCESEDDIFVEARELPVISINPVTICQGESANLVANPHPNDYTFNWEHGAYGYQTQVTPLQHTTYTVVVTDDLGCSAEYSTDITVNPEPSFTLADQIVCYGETTNIQVNGVFPQYLWNTGANGSFLQVVASQTADYSCTVTNNFGCSKTDEMTLEVMQPTPLIIEDVDLCEGESTTVISPIGFTGHHWSNGVYYESINITANNTSNYTLDAIDINGCESSTTFTVFANPYPIVEILDFGVNEGESRIVNAPGGYSEYLWSTGHMDESIIVTPYESTDYWVRITTEHGCSSIDSFNIRVYDLPEIDIPDMEICRGETITLEAPEGYVNYLWTVGEENFESSIINIQPENTVVCYLQLENSTGGIGGTNFLITVNEAPIINLDNSYTICYDESISLETLSGYSSYEWSTGATTNAINISPETSTNYTLSVESDNGCISTKNISVVVDNPYTDFNPSMTYPRPGDAVHFSLDSYNETSSYLWNFGDGGTSDANNPTYYFYTEGVYDVSLEVVTENECSARIEKEGLISVNSTNSGINSLEKTEMSGSIFIYPIPAINTLNVQLSKEYNKAHTIISIYNSNGMLLHQEKKNTYSKISLEIGDFKPGNYVISIEHNNKITTGKFIKQ